jgi:hypothetical protein
VIDHAFSELKLGLRAADAEEVAQLKTDVETLVGALHQATAEN